MQLFLLGDIGGLLYAGVFDALLWEEYNRNEMKITQSQRIRRE